MSGALDPVIQKEVVERDLYATAVLSGNRNFDGRIHPYAKQAFLASPPLVVAYAIAGTIRFDIEKDVLGIDADGKPVTLKDIWPSTRRSTPSSPPASSRSSSARSTSRCSPAGRRRRQGQPAVRLAPA
jgi:aconitase A